MHPIFVKHAIYLFRSSYTVPCTAPSGLSWHLVLYHTSFTLHVLLWSTVFLLKGNLNFNPVTSMNLKKLSRICINMSVPGSHLLQPHYRKFFPMYINYIPNQTSIWVTNLLFISDSSMTGMDLINAGTIRQKHFPKLMHSTRRNDIIQRVSGYLTGWHSNVARFLTIKPFL